MVPQLAALLALLLVPPALLVPLVPPALLALPVPLACRP